MSIFGGVISIKDVAFLMFCVFGIIAVGMALGRISIKGVSLGTAGVFIVAIVFGCLFYKNLDAALAENAKQCLKIVENLGLVMFVTSVGFIAGPKFFSNMKKNFKSYVLLGLIIILVGGVAAIGCIMFGRYVGGETDFDKLTAMVTGLLSGALTSTPAFSAAKATVASQYEDIVVVGYGIAYLFGVVGVVLFVQLMPKITKANMSDEVKKLTQASDGVAKERPKHKLLEMDSFGFCVFALAAVIGIFVGMIKIPLSGKGLSGTTFSLTTMGGCLLVALLFGHFGHVGKVDLMPKDTTLKTLRELGLIFFLLGAGVAGGANFIANFQPIYFVYGMIMTLVPMIVGYIFAKYVLHMNLLNALGSITGGMTSTPALGTLINVSGTEDVASAYAATYPVALIAVVLVAQFLIILF